MSNLFYVIGASGAGKDTLMNYARQTINGTCAVIFAHRYITRLPDNGNENHIYLTPEEFRLRRDAGFFALHWESHGKYYGVGAELNNWLKEGFNVVVNGSREYLPMAREIYPEIVVVLIEASPETVALRLASRGRESADEIESRISRTQQINTDLGNCIKIQNNHTVESAGDRLIRVISTEKETNNG